MTVRTITVRTETIIEGPDEYGGPDDYGRFKPLVGQPPPVPADGRDGESDEPRREDVPNGRESRHEEVLRARGHENVTATHGSTVEVTTDDWLTPAGDCIVGVAADRAPVDFDPTFVEACRDPAAEITLTLDAGGRVDSVRGRGHPDLTFASDRSAVARTSDHVDDRTVLVGADGAAADVDRDLVAALAAGADLVATLTVR